jgi:hypothetical protein
MSLRTKRSNRLLINNLLIASIRRSVDFAMKLGCCITLNVNIIVFSVDILRLLYLFLKNIFRC